MIEITKAKPKPFYPSESFVLKPDKPFELIEVERPIEPPLTTFDKIILIKDLIPFFYKIIRGDVMKDWKTTLSGAIGGAAVLLSVFGLQIPPEIVGGITAVSVFFIGFFAKDGDKNEK